MKKKIGKEGCPRPCPRAGGRECAGEKGVCDPRLGLVLHWVIRASFLPGQSSMLALMLLTEALKRDFGFFKPFRISLSKLAKIAGVERTTFSKQIRAIRHAGLIKTTPEGVGMGLFVTLLPASISLTREARKINSTHCKWVFEILAGQKVESQDRDASHPGQNDNLGVS